MISLNIFRFAKNTKVTDKGVCDVLDTWKRLVDKKLESFWQSLIINLKTAYTKSCLQFQTKHPYVCAG